MPAKYQAQPGDTFLSLAEGDPELARRLQELNRMQTLPTGSFVTIPERRANPNPAYFDPTWTGTPDTGLQSPPRTAGASGGSLQDEDYRFSQLPSGAQNLGITLDKMTGFADVNMPSFADFGREMTPEWRDAIQGNPMLSWLDVQKFSYTESPLAPFAESSDTYMLPSEQEQPGLGMAPTIAEVEAFNINKREMDRGIDPNAYHVQFADGGEIGGIYKTIENGTFNWDLVDPNTQYGRWLEKYAGITAQDNPDYLNTGGLDVPAADEDNPYVWSWPSVGNRNKTGNYTSASLNWRINFGG